MRCEACHRETPEDAAFCPYCGEKLSGSKAKSSAFEYVAFISYRHLPRDQEVAKRVQQAIETYRLPSGAVSGAKNARLGKCFRDEDELAATYSLPDRILDALAKSSSLIVICTPDTAGSAWVQREVTAFINMHGRERVFTVLAAGDSAESIPDYLKSSATSLDNEQDFRSNPLAADMRSSASAKMREETLRLIAAIANCGFDDLKQRDRARRRKKNAIVAVAVILIAAIMAAALAFASASRQNALAADSRKLAVESEQLLAQGDRYGALEKALEALPKSESSNDRPYISEARAALEDALQIEFDENHPWNLRYSIDAEGEIEEIRFSPDEGWVAILDSEMTLAFYEIGTGRKISEVQLLSLIEGEPEETDLDPYEWSLSPAADKLIVWERNGSCVFCCIDVKTGEVAWKYNDMVNALSVSDDAEIATFLGHSGDEFYVGAVHIPTGEWWGSHTFNNPGIPHYSRELPSCMGDYATTLYVGFDRVTNKYDIAENTEASASIPNSDGVHSIARADNALIVATSTFSDSDDSLSRPKSAEFAVSAIDANMQILWSSSSAWTLQSIDSERGYVGADQDPTANKFLMANGPAVVALAGNTVRVLSCEDGEAIYEETFDSPVVGADPIGFEEDDFVLYITCGDGTVYARAIDSQGSEGGPVVFNYPGPVDNAHLDFYTHNGFFALARSLDNPHRMFAYQAETRTAQDVVPASNYSLDELIAMAHDELDAIAQ